MHSHLEQSRAQKNDKRVDPGTLRAVASTFATGVTAITCTAEDGRPQGCAANAVLSVSLEPPLMLVSLAETSRTKTAIERTKTFAINVIPDNPQGAALCRKFASRAGDKFATTAYRTGVLGAPVLHDALGWFECTVRSTIPVGDHTLFLGLVVEAGHEDGAPLIFFRGENRRLAS